MDCTAWVQSATEVALAALALAGALHLARRGGFAPAQTGLVLVAGEGLWAGEASAAAGWVWLLVMGANLLVAYALWQVGSLVLALRECGEERQRQSREESRAEASVVELPRVRAVASWPGRR